MKKYLKEIELSGIILMLLGVIMYRFMGLQSGFIACAIGMLLWLSEVIYKAFHWQEYGADNKKNNLIMLIAIVLLLGSLIILLR